MSTQTGLSSVSYSNSGEGSTREVTLEPDITGIVSEKLSTTPLCPAAGTTGTYKGDITMTGENAAGTEHIGVFVD